MKRSMLFMLIAVVALSVALAGCTKEEASQPDETEAVKKAAPAKEAKPAPKPEPKPEPAPVPKAKPEPKPELKPAPKPEPKPAPKAEPKPEPKPEAKTGGKVKGPWSDAKVGWMVTYKMIGGMKSKREVTAVEEEFITLRMTTTQADGTVLGKPMEMKMPRYGKAGATGKTTATRKKIGAETLNIGGKTLECDVWEMTMDVNGKKVTSKSWECKEVPGLIVKSDSDAMGEMKTMIELVEFSK